MQVSPHNHQLHALPQTYLPGSPIANLNYQTPAFFSPSLPPARAPTPGYPPGLRPGVATDLLVTSGPGYVTPGAAYDLNAFNGYEVLGGGGYYRQQFAPQYPISPAIATLNPVPIGNQTIVQGQRTGLQGFSQIQYVPYESYYIDYEERQFVQNVLVPIQRSTTDYYAVEHVVDYVPQQYEETIVEMVPEERSTERVVYVPIETQVVHYPQEELRKPAQAQRVVTEVKEVRPAVAIETTAQPKTVIAGGSAAILQVPGTQTIVQNSTSRNIIGTGVIPQPAIFQPSTQPRNPLPTNLPSQVPPSAPPQPVVIQATKPVQGGQQFVQNPEILQRNKAEFEQKMGLPDNARVQYQYSTKMVRRISQQQAQKYKNGPVVTQLPAVGVLPPQAGQAPQPQGQNQVRPQPQSQVQPQGRLQPQLQPQVQPRLQPQPQTRPAPNSSLLSANNQVDLADSQHIAITKSTYNAQYNNSTLSNAFSFGSPQSIVQNTQSFVNQSFAANSANRDSAGVFDYGSQRPY